MNAGTVARLADLALAPIPSPGTATTTPGPVVSNSDSGSDFVERFLTSAGFGGAMAVVAAVIAAAITYLQFRHTRRLDESKHWWETLTWVYDRTIVSDDRTPLPQVVTFSMLTVLNEQTKIRKASLLQSEAIGAILGMFADRTKMHNDPVDSSESTRETPTSEPADVGAIPVTSPKAVEMLTALKDDLYQQEAKQLSSYERHARAALYQAAAETDIDIVNLLKDDFGDYRLTDGRHQVVACVRFYTYPPLGLTAALLVDQIQRRLEAGSFRYLVLVSNYNLEHEFAAYIREENRNRVGHVMYNGKADYIDLVAAIVTGLTEQDR